jgi:hypothetical protein
MSRRKSALEMQKQLSILKDEEVKDKMELDLLKKSLSENIKKVDKTEIKNTITVEPKYTIWQRILRTLGMN